MRKYKPISLFNAQGDGQLALFQRIVALVRELCNQIQPKFLSETVDKLVLKIIADDNLYTVNVNVLLCNFSVKKLYLGRKGNHRNYNNKKQLI